MWHPYIPIVINQHMVYGKNSSSLHQNKVKLNLIKLKSRQQQQQIVTSNERQFIDNNNK